MRVSIIIPIYQVEEYVGRCLRSVMEQRYEEIECILVDDCGTDRSIDICESLIGEYFGPIRFRILHHEHNRGLSAARNTGTAAATGEYIFYLDSDDELSPDCIALMTEEVQKHEGIDMVTAAVESTPHDAYYDLTCLSQYRHIEMPKYACYMYNKPERDFPVCAWNKLVRKAFLEEHGIGFKEGIVHEDELWSALVSQHLKSYSLLPQRTYLHRTSVEGSIMNSTENSIRARCYIIVFEEIVHNIEEGETAMLQFYKAYTEYLMLWYRALPKAEYQGARREACRFLIRHHKYHAALYTHFFFKWNSALHLRKYEPQICDYIEQRWRREAEKVQEKIEAEREGKRERDER